MSTLRVSNIEAKADASSPTVDEKVKVTSSQGRVLVQVDGKTAGITSIGINTTSTSFTIDANQNVQFVGVITAPSVNTTGVSTFTRLNVGTGGTVITTTTSGLVGIGTTNPVGIFYIKAGTNRNFNFDTGGGSGAADLRISALNDAANANVDLQIQAANVLFNSNGSEKVRITSGGNLGIGITNPSYKVNIEHSGDTAIFINKTTASWGGYNSGTHAIQMMSPNMGTSDNFAALEFGKSLDGFNSAHIDYCHLDDGSSSNYLALGLFNADKVLNITAGSNVGIGVTNPTTDLTILKTVAGGNGALLSIQNRSNTAGTKCGIMFGVDSSDANWSDVGNAQIIMESSGSSVGQLKFRVYDSADSEAMKIAGDGSGNFRNGVAFARAGIAFDNSWDGFPGIVVFATDGYGNSSNRSEFRIHGFSHTYAAYPGAPAADFGTNLRIDGSTYFSSDSRHKTNIVDNPYGLNEILQLQPRKFNRINSSGEIEEHQGDILGFIAQEVKEVIPEAVNYYPDEDTPNEVGWCRAYALSEGYILSTLVNAVKEQNAIIESLKSRIETLESQINT